MPSCQSRREPPQGRGAEDWIVGAVLFARKEAHVGETVELTIVVLEEEKKEGQSQPAMCHRTRMDKVCVDYVCGATVTAINRLIDDKVGWPRRGVSGRPGSGQRAVGASPAAACTRKVEPSRFALAGPAAWVVLGVVRLGRAWSGLVGLRRCLSCAQTADLTLLCFAGTCLCLYLGAGCLCLCLCSDETWGRERQAVGCPLHPCLNDGQGGSGKRSDGVSMELCTVARGWADS